MKTSDLPTLPKSRRDTYDYVIDDVDEALINELYWFYFIGTGMPDPLFHPIMYSLWHLLAAVEKCDTIEQCHTFKTFPVRLLQPVNIYEQTTTQS